VKQIVFVTIILCSTAIILDIMAKQYSILYTVYVQLATAFYIKQQHGKGIPSRLLVISKSFL